MEQHGVQDFIQVGEAKFGNENLRYHTFNDRVKAIYDKVLKSKACAD